MGGRFAIECPLVNLSTLDNEEYEKFQESPASARRFLPLLGTTLWIRSRPNRRSRFKLAPFHRTLLPRFLKAGGGCLLRSQEFSRVKAPFAARSGQLCGPTDSSANVEG